MSHYRPKHAQRMHIHLPSLRALANLAAIGCMFLGYVHIGFLWLTGTI